MSLYSRTDAPQKRVGPLPSDKMKLRSDMPNRASASHYDRISIYSSAIGQEPSMIMNISLGGPPAPPYYVTS
jgi:hypothetical protein